jgi:signal transduction histidine kinase
VPKGRRPTSPRPANWSRWPTAVPRTPSPTCATWCAGSTRPAPAIETIAYFCAAELLANAAKHSHATRVALGVTGSGGHLTLTVEDDGVGGANPDGPGLSGLARRIAVVDGRMRVRSPAGGPTRVEIELPTRV